MNCSVRLMEINYSKDSVSTKMEVESAKSSNSKDYSIGQEVELMDLEVTSKGVLRGKIAGTSIGAIL